MLYDYAHHTPTRLLQESGKVYPFIAQCHQQIWACYQLLCDCFAQGGKLMVAGNGGSASDSAHIVGELMKGFMSRRPMTMQQQALFNLLGKDGQRMAATLQRTLPAIALTEQSALLSAFANDVAPDLVFAQQVFGYAQPHDIFLGLSTSGNSSNVLMAAKAAKAMKIKAIGITGAAPNGLCEVCDVCVALPCSGTPQIQEATLPTYHLLCMMLEKHFFDEEAL